MSGHIHGRMRGESYAQHIVAAGAHHHPAPRVWATCCGNRPRVGRDDGVWKARCLMCFREATAETCGEALDRWTEKIKEPNQ